MSFYDHDELNFRKYLCHLAIPVESVLILDVSFNPDKNKTCFDFYMTIGTNKDKRAIGRRLLKVT